MRMRTGWLAVLMLAQGACTHVEPLPDWVETPSAEQLDQVVAGEGLFDEPVRGKEPPRYELMALSPEMERVAEEVAARYRSQSARAEALHRALLSSPMAGGRGIEYSARQTAPAIDAFESRRVNCLSFTLLYTSMARHIGLDVQGNDVEIPPSWDLLRDNSYLFLRHVNAKVQLPRGEQLVIDLEMERYSPAYDQRRISDRLLEAQFYNNRGMELVAKGEHREGFLHLRRALVLDDGQSYIWSNLGTLYKRRGHDREAEWAYLQGLSLDPQDLTLMNNLSHLYRDRDQNDKAEYFYQRAKEHRNSNPYYLYSKARARLAAGDLAEAERYLEQAMERENEEPRFYQLAAEIYDQRDRPEKAEAMRREAERWQEALYL